MLSVEVKRSLISINTNCINELFTCLWTSPKSQYMLKPIIANLGNMFIDESQWNTFLAKNEIVKERHIRIATEGALIGAIMEHGLSPP